MKILDNITNTVRDDLRVEIKKGSRVSIAADPERAVFDHADKGRFAMFDKVSGSKQIRERFSKRNRWEDIREYWYKDVEDFRKLSKPYYLYK